MRKVVLFTAIAALALSIGIFAQSKPDFTGKWLLDPAKSEMGGAPGGGGAGRAGGAMAAAPIAITQTAAELTIERTMGENIVKTIYKLDGTESVNETTRGKSTSVSKWDGAKLVTTIKAETQRGTMESTETRSLAADGTMVVETLRQGPSGPTTTKAVYNKQK
jgi:hypothetical protein